jgi:hypothetical protein
LYTAGDNLAPLSPRPVWYLFPPWPPGSILGLFFMFPPCKGGLRMDFGDKPSPSQTGLLLVLVFTSV